MGELANRTHWALVQYSSAAAELAWAGLAAQAAVTTQGPGLSQADAVQVVTELAVLRDRCAAWIRVNAVEMTPAGEAIKVWHVFGPDATNTLEQQIQARGNHMVYLVGDAPPSKWGPGGFSGPGDTTPSLTSLVTTPQQLQALSPKWGEQLALALDQCITVIGKAPQGPTVLPGAVPGMSLGMAAIIVTGAAIAVIGTVAAWRYLDPDFRTSALLVKAAAESYVARLTTYQTTGVMPPASDIEKQAAGTVQTLAGQRNQTAWLWGAGITGGVALGFVLLAALGSGGSKRNLVPEMHAA